jgi:short-subunit dehydrogenase
MTFRNQVVWITGASGGIGEALAYELSRRGACLVLSARRREALERVRNRCTDPGRHLVLPLDMTAPDTFGAALREVLETCGQLDMLVNNAGVSQRSLVKDTVLAVDRALMEVDYFGPVALTETVLPYFLERGVGRFVAVSSIAGLVATPLRSTYAAAKHALRAFYDSLRAEVHDSGVRVSVVYPGFVRTSISLSALTGDGSPQGRMDEALDSGMDPGEFASRMAAALDKGEDHIVIGGPKERLAVYVDRVSPDLRHWLMRRVKVT